MAHEISIVNGKAEIAWAGQVPWHGLGQNMDKRQSPEQALRYAGMTWMVEKRPLWYQEDMKTEEFTEVEDRYAMVRADTGAYLGTVGPQYTPIQNVEQAEFITALCDSGAVVEVVGALFGGAKTFWTCKLPNDLIINTPFGKDRSKQNLIVTNGHDGMDSFLSWWTQTRVVCNNTRRLALRDKADGISLRHTRNVKDRMKVAAEVLGIISNSAKKEAEALQALAEMKVAAMSDLHTLFDEIILPDTEEKRAEETDVQKAKRIDLRELWVANVATEAKLTRPGQKGIYRWDALNAITYWANHQQRENGMRAKGAELTKNREAKFERVLFGTGHRMMQRAVTILSDPKIGDSRVKRTLASSPASN